MIIIIIIQNTSSETSRNRVNDNTKSNENYIDNIDDGNIKQ